MSASGAMVQSLTDGGFLARETERLVLRRITVDDWQSVHRYMSDTVVTKWLPEGILDEEQSREFAIKNSVENPQAIAVLTRDSKEFVGHVVFHPWFALQTYEIGWVLGREHQRRGYATEAGEIAGSLRVRIASVPSSNCDLSAGKCGLVAGNGKA